jgi:predicted O-methyltransferase YrrM
MFKFPKNLEIDEIYKKFNINPVSYGNKLSKSNYLKIKSQRKTLFYDHLKIPLSFIKNKNILEFGPASGEKSLVYAYYGAKLHLVDSNIDFLRLLKSNFKDYKFSKFISKIENRHIENFSSKKKYDLVVAENFLSSTKNRNKNLRTVLDQCNKNGFVLISNSDEYGYFFDFLKSFILKLYFHKNNITDLERMVNVSK